MTIEKQSRSAATHLSDKGGRGAEIKRIRPLRHCSGPDLVTVTASRFKKRINGKSSGNNRRRGNSPLSLEVRY